MTTVKGSILKLGIKTAGSGLSNGTTNDVDLIGGSGQNAKANITVANGTVTVAQVATAGSAYQIKDELTVSGFSGVVLTVDQIPYSTLSPSSRNYNPGNWPVKTYNSMSGREIRLRYGDKRFNTKLSLQYQNISDTNVSDFLAHFDAQFGTYTSFALSTQVLSGWSGSSYIPNASAMKFRYSQAPTVVSVRPGVSTVSVELTGVI